MNEFIVLYEYVYVHMAYPLLIAEQSFAPGSEGNIAFERDESANRRDRHRSSLNGKIQRAVTHAIDGFLISSLG
jgi:hypothetical protein